MNYINLNIKFKDELNFKKYTLITCINYLKDNKAHEFCFNFNIKVLFVNKNSLLNNYLNIITHKMT